MSTSVSPRIPAWKRLGLKLKSEGNAPSPVTPSESPAYVAAEQPKRKRSPEASEATPIKKSKKVLKITESAVSSSPAKQQDDKHVRRKSVAFTAETKTEDGDSIKQLFGAWVAEQKKLDPNFVTKKDQPALQTPEPSKVAEDIDTTLDESERRVKRIKPAKSDEKPKAKKAKSSKVVKSKPIDPALSYLKQFHSDKATWKFNKINQISVLKNAFDIELIPSEYSEALYAYIAGLKGVARIHLRDRALAIRDQDQEDGENGFPDTMADRERRQEEYEAAVEEYIATMKAQDISSRTGYEEGILLGLNPEAAMRQRMEKRMRAERVLNLLASTPGDPSEFIAPPEKQGKRVMLEDAAPQKIVRKRKQRTAAIESDSSSSDDSDNNDSDSGTSEDGESSDDEDSSDTAEEDDTSSDGTSSSSSTSSSGSSSDSGSENSTSSESEDSE